MTFDRSAYINEATPIEKELSILFNKNAGLTIFEIGACEGEDSIKYSRLFVNSAIYAFEPLPKNVEQIRRNIVKYNRDNISVYNKAISSEVGTAEFYVSDGKPETASEADWDYGNKSSSLLPPDKHKELAAFINFNERINVDTITISAFCNEKNISSIDFIHLDVQGAELMVLKGAGDFIKSIKAIWLEVSKIALYKDQPLAEDIAKFMSSNNFVLFKDTLKGMQGDQLYISKTHFPNHMSLKKKLNRFSSSIISKIFSRVAFIGRYW